LAIPHWILMIYGTSRLFTVLIDRGHLSAVARQIAAYQVQQEEAAVFVCKVSANEKHFLLEAFQPTAHRLMICQFQLTDSYKASFSCLLPVKANKQQSFWALMKCLSFFRMNSKFSFAANQLSVKT
jgi:hypothetical protein